MLKKTFLFLFLVSVFLFSIYTSNKVDSETIKVGILHSSTGTMAISEQSVLDATMFAIDELNQKGGLLGKKIEPLIIDGASSPELFYKGALELLREENNIDVVFGCWTSASRKMVKPIFEKNNHLLIYPVQFEGLETSPNIFYTGLTPNQQVLPALNWALKHIGKRVYLLGSDYIYPRVTNAYIKDILFSLDIEIVGEAYLPLGSADFSGVIDEIKAKSPDLIINTINGDSNLHFFKSLQDAGLPKNNTSILSFSITENEFKKLSKTGIRLKNNYVALSYLSSDKNKANAEFIKNFHHYIGKKNPITGPMVSAYIGVNLWAKAVTRSRSSNPFIIKDSILKQIFFGPNGLNFSNTDQRKLLHPINIGLVDEKGAIKKVWAYKKQIQPITFPYYRSQEEWKILLAELYKEYDQKWER